MLAYCEIGRGLSPALDIVIEMLAHQVVASASYPLSVLAQVSVFAAAPAATLEGGRTLAAEVQDRGARLRPRHWAVALGGAAHTSDQPPQFSCRGTAVYSRILRIGVWRISLLLS